jgi:FkbM family methyltransferase
MSWRTSAVPVKVKGAVRGGLNRLGYDLRRLNEVEPDPMPYLLRSALSVYGIDLVIDVGANRGQWGASLRQGGYQGQIVSFEPVSGARDALAQIAAQATRMTWKVRREALGDSDDAGAPMNVAALDQHSSLLQPSPEVLASYGDTYGVVRIESVPVARLDSIWDEVVPPGARVMLKTDAQGYDMRIIRGAGEKLALVSCVLLEVSLRPAYVGSDNGLRDVLNHLEEYGFRLAGLSPVPGSRAHSPSLALSDSDALFVHPATRTNL